MPAMALPRPRRSEGGPEGLHDASEPGPGQGAKRAAKRAARSPEQPLFLRGGKRTLATPLSYLTSCT